MRAAALQFDVSRDVATNLDLVEPLLERAAAEGVELVLLPEMWASSFPAGRAGLHERVAADRAACERLRELSAALGLSIAGSALHGDGERVHNRLELFEDGASLWHYDKVHLFTPTAEQEVFVAGDAPPGVAASRLGRISGGVCYDLRFPELLRVPFREGAQVLLVPAQWPTPRRDHWVALAIARAIENQCFLVACNRLGSIEIGRKRRRLEFPGDSLIVSPYGELLAGPGGEPGLVVADLDLDLARHFRTRVPVAKDERPELYQRWLEPGGGPAGAPAD